jgi:hypothetical protein
MPHAFEREGWLVRFSGMPSWRHKRPRVRLFWVMILIALIAVTLRLPVWLKAAGFRPPDWWETYWREKPARDAWRGPIVIRVTRQDDIQFVLTRF